MKRLLLYFFLLIFTANVKAQTYQSIFGSIQTAWNIKHQQLFGDYTDSLAVANDTVINSYQYKKMNCYSYFSPIPVLQPYNGFIREDTLTGRVWYFSTADTTERLISDMTLTVADSFKVFNIGGNAFYQVDSVYYEFNKKHIRLNLSLPYTPPSEKFTLIEGTGSNIGIRYSDTQWPGINPFLLCQYKDYFVEYINMDSASGNSCMVITQNANLEFDTYVKLYPNPCSNNVIIETDRNYHEALNVSIIDLQGRVIMYKQIISENENSGLLNLDVSQVPDGLYFLCLSSAKSNHYIKLIKR